MFEIGNIVRLIATPEQKAYVCRDALLGTCCSFGICPFDGPVYTVNSGMKGQFGPKAREWELDPTALLGTVNITKDSDVIIGSGTTFTTDYQVSDRIIIGMWQRTIVSIDSDMQITVSGNYPKTKTGLEHRNLD